MKKTTKLFLFTIITCVSGLSFGQNRYVSNTGNDASNDCSSISSPFKTISAAVTSAIAGDSILIAPGVYTLSGTLGISKSDLKINALDPSSKPVITSNASDVMNVNAPNVSISNLVMKMGLTSSTGLRGIVAAANYSGIKISSCELYSINPGGFLSTGMVFGSYAILLYEPSSQVINISITNNIIGTENTENDVFGRGIGLGFNAGGTSAPGGLIDNNDITAYYSMQTIGISSDIMISNNHLKGMTMINATENNTIATFDHNVLDAVEDQYAANIFTLLDIRATNTGSVVVSHNAFNNYLTTAVFSMASRNVSIVGNTFSPSTAANQFISVVANTKLQTSGTQNNTYSDGITITGNIFNAGLADKGTAIVFADHYGNNTPAFSRIVVGGQVETDKNIFDTTLGHFIQLDTLSGSSDQVTLWNPGLGGDHTPVTTMKPINQDIIALATDNYYGFSVITDIEDRNTDSLDINGLGKIILGYVSPAGIDENKKNISATLYPNPVADNLNIVLNEGTEKAAIQIIDVLGNVIYSTTIHSKEIINVNTYKAGVYFVRLTSNNQTYSARIIKN
jgi:hypothetical protein